MIEQLRETCKRLLEEGKVNVVIGYGQDTPNGPVHPVFVTRPDQVERLVWNDQCFHNLATYLTRRDVKALGKPAIIVKGCDERAIVVLEQESQFKREDIYVIGVACDGVGSPHLAKCAACGVHMPRFADETVGESNAQPVADERFAALDTFLQKPLQERLEYWMQELSRCIKCYACREVCPMCYCPRCIVDKNRPTALDTSATLKGNFAWQITRAFHQSGRCVSCGECGRVCPAGIDLSLLNLSLTRAAEEHFDYRAGMDKDTPPIIGSYALEDKENFIL